MSEYTAKIEWQHDGSSFTANRYSRKHLWSFDGGLQVPASSSPQVVPLPMSDSTAVDPEEAFVASVASCHMLWFLALAAKRGYTVAQYSDQASGVMSKNTQGKVAMTLITLRPNVQFSGQLLPDAAAHQDLHRLAHDNCYIASSITAEVRCEPTLDN
jgi:organic hydroperoxide reductase OsmC/OhrA